MEMENKQAPSDTVNLANIPSCITEFLYMCHYSICYIEFLQIWIPAVWPSA